MLQEDDGESVGPIEFWKKTHYTEKGWKTPMAQQLYVFALAMDESILDVDQVENLLKFCPTKEEMEMLKVVNRTSTPDKSKVRCGADQRPPKTTNLRFIAEQINDHRRRQENGSDVAESEQRNCRTTDIRVDGVDDRQIAESMDSTAYI
ncbi:hypothetical protein Scep_011919 [Stephania cephalantha]|uniref:Uncharacterized protein n=1 Tax=Stephania cephalantha TaxID=152367 RepID=A0AAP0JFN5_9MAGN